MPDTMEQTVIKSPSWWRRRTDMERRLTLVATLALLAAAALAVSLGHLAARWQQRCESVTSLALEARGNVSAGDFQLSAPQSDVCLTPGCIRAASTVLDLMDPSVDPCDDFYQYACGNYRRTTNVPDDKSSVSTYSDIEDQMLQKLRTALEEEGGAVIPRSLQLAHKLYSACINQSLVESLGLSPLQMVLREQLGGWPVLEGDSWDEEGFHWVQSVRRLRSAGISTDQLIHFSVDSDYRNSSRHSIVLDQASLGLDREFLVHGLSDKLVDAYYQYQVDVAVLLGADRARAERELRQSLEFEIALANISLASEQRRDWSLLYHPRSVDQLQADYPSVPWLEFLKVLLPPHVAVSSQEVVVVVAPSYLKGLEALLSQTPNRVVSNYVMWRAVQASVPYTTERLRARQLSYQSLLTGRVEHGPRWRECVDLVTDLMYVAVGAIYVRKYFDKEAKQAAAEMVDDVRREFLSMLEQVDWMDDDTRKKALEKAQSMVSHVAYPDEPLDDGKLDRFYEKLEVSAARYLESVLNATRFSADYSFGQLRQPVNKTEWIGHSYAAMVGAYYNPMQNSIGVPAGILQGVFFGADLPKYMNYGGLGSAIGHEITHGFDDEGSQFDKDGNVVDWWDPVTREKFLKKAECIILQYGNFTDEQTGMHLNGVNTQGENMADNGGIKQAYLAYLALEGRAGQMEPRLPALTHLSPRQMFWLAAAHTWCSRYRTEELRQQIMTGVHSPNRFRVLGPAANHPEFAEDFKCPVGSRMNPVEKCQAW